MTEQRLQGIAASEGVAIGRIVRYVPSRIQVSEEQLAPDMVEVEISRLHQAIDVVRERLAAARASAIRSAEGDEAAIFDAHALMLDDPALIGEAERRIREEQRQAAYALQEAATAVRQMLDQIGDSYIRERAADLDDITGQIIRALDGEGSSSLDQLPERAIVIAEELFPSDTALLDTSRVVGIATERGSRTAHVAILARGMGMPAIVGLSGLLDAAQDGDEAVINGETGELIITPAQETLTATRARIETAHVDDETVDLPASTADGTRIELLANIGNPAEAETALRHGAEGVGLFRTEFLFLDRPEPPSEEEQYETYRRVAEIMGERPVVIRTLDVGGDKPVPGITLPREDNPFLGTRGLRLSLRQPEIFRAQLRAILRASTTGNVRVMFPMVTTIDDVREARAILNRVRAELEESGVPHRGDLPVGIMIEVPAAALAADLLAREVDFFSIGTNDLVQYTLAVDRTNNQLASRYDPLDPGVLRLIQATVQAAQAAGKPVAVCGELASEPAAIPTLVGLGVRELSMAAPAIGGVARIIHGLDSSATEKEVQRKLTGR